MSVRQDIVDLIINVNGNAAQNQLNELRKSAADLKISMKGLKAGTQEYIDANDSLNAVNAKMKELKQSIGITALSQKELTAELKKLSALRGSVTPFSAEYKELSKQIDAVQSRLYNVRNNVQGLASVFSKVGDSVKQFGVLAASYLGFQFLTTQFTNIIQGAGKLSDQLADLRRVSGFTADEVNHLNAGLSKLDTRTSTSALRDIAIVAGKLGVAKDDILGFTKAVNMLVVALGDELGDADQITTQLGKILNVFDGKITGENITKLGNAIVDLANSGVATGGFVVDFTQRLSGLAKSANIALPALLGLGAGLEESGAKVEAASTAVSKLVTHIAQDVPKAAKIAGASTQEEIDKFADTFAKKPEEALLQFAAGLQKNKKDFAEIADSFKDAGESGARVITTLATLGVRTDFFREKMAEAGAAIKQTDAIQNAFNLKNETLGATLDKLGKQFFAFVQSSGISNFLKAAVQDTSDFIKWLGQLPKLIDDNKGSFYALIAAIVIYNASIIKSTIVSAALRIETIANAVANKAAAIATALAESAQAAYIVVTNLLTGKIKLATAAQRLWNIAMSLGAGAVGIVVVAAVALVKILESIYSGYNKVLIQQKAALDLAKEAANNYGDQINKLQILERALESSNTSLETKKKAYQELIAINPEFAKTLQLDINGHLQGAEAIQEYIRALKQKGEVEAAQNLSNEKNQEILQLQQERYARSLKSDATINDGKGSGAFQYDIAKIDEKIKALQTAKDFFDKKITDALGGTLQFTLPSDTVVGQKAAEDPSVAARRKALQKMIDDSKAAYETLNANDKAGQLANLALREKYQKELDALDNKKPKKNSEYDRLLKEAQDFYKSLQKLKEDADNADKSQDEKDLIALQRKYDDLHAKALEYFKKNIIDRKTYNAEEKLIVATFQQELANLEKKQFGEHSEEEYTRALKDTQDYFDEQRHLESTRYTEGKQTKQEYDTAIQDLDLHQKDQMVMVAQDYSKTVKKAAEDVTKFKKAQLDQQDSDDREATAKSLQRAKDEAIAKLKLAVIKAPNGSKDQQEAQKALLKEQFAQDTALMDKKSEVYLEAEAELQQKLQQTDDDYNQQRIQHWSDVGQQLVSITDNLFQVLNNLDERALQKEQQINDKKKAGFKKQLDDKLISQKQYDLKVAAADAEMDKKKADLQLVEAKRQKAQQIFAAITNTASAVAGALGSPPVGPWNIALAALMGALGAVQIGVIETQPLPDTSSYGDGGLLKNGPYHKDKEKGLQVIDPRTGNTEMYLEKDEAVIKGDAIRDKKKYSVSGTPSQIASKLNSMHGGVDWAPGAVINMPAFRKPAPTMRSDIPRIMEQGGLIRPLTKNSDTSGNGQLIDLLQKNNQLLQESNDIARNQKEKLHAVVSIKEYRETEKQYDASIKAGGMSQ